MPEFFPFEPIILILNIFWQVLKVWWWVLLPIILFFPFKFIYLFYIQEKWDNTIKKIILEIKIPEEVPRLIQSMEQVFAGFHGIHDIITWKQKWIEGQYQLSISLEIVSIEGEIHFFIRTPEPFRDIIESNIYAQFPNAETSPESAPRANLAAEWKECRNSTGSLNIIIIFDAGLKRLIS